jgi:hypothetical protein
MEVNSLLTNDCRGRIFRRSNVDFVSLFASGHSQWESMRHEVPTNIGDEQKTWSTASGRSGVSGMLISLFLVCVGPIARVAHGWLPDRKVFNTSDTGRYLVLLQKRLRSIAGVLFKD